MKHYKNITPEQKLLQAALLYKNAKELKRAALKKRYPELTDEQIEAKIRNLMSNAAR